MGYSTLKLLSRSILETLLLCISTVPALIARRWHRSVWIVSERPDQARDNGFIFFRYMRQMHQDHETYYIIDKSASDYQKVKDLGNIIQYGSPKHYLFFCMSKVHISSHRGGCTPTDARISRLFKRTLHLKYVFLPHGVSYGISEFCLAKYSNIDLFICSGQQEYENVLNNYGYRKEEVAYTGFPRLDIWHDYNVNNKQIVLMPTWRSYLAQNPSCVFENTEYYHTFNELINSSSLDELLHNNEIELIVYLHHEMRKYVDAFSTNAGNIRMVYRDDEYDIQELLKESALLITDYSSVHFDFAYMGKPVIYYQFDREEFFSRQYQEGAFDFLSDGFGPVVLNIDDLISELTKLIEMKFKMEQEYYSRMRRFYRLYDNNNCDRVYNVICERCG